VNYPPDGHRCACGAVDCQGGEEHMRRWRTLERRHPSRIDVVDFDRWAQAVLKDHHWAEQVQRVGRARQQLLPLTMRLP
jgi:hypothetical protein